MYEIVVSDEDKSIIEKIKKHDIWMSQVPERFMTEAVCCYFARTIDYALCFIPRHKRTEAVIFAAASNFARALKYVDKDEQTYEIALAAIKNDSDALEYVSKKYYTDELLRLALEQKGSSLKYLPKRSQTYKLCCLAIDNDGLTLKNVAKRLIDKNLCELAIKNNGAALEYVPEKLKSHELCLKAVQNNGGALCFVPDEWIDEEMYRVSAQNSKYLLRALPKKYHEESIYKNVVAHDGLALEYVDNRKLTSAVCEIAVDNNGRALEFVPTKYITIELCEKAIENCVEALRFVPKTYFTGEFLIRALEIDASSFEYAPVFAYFDSELCEIALNIDGANLEYVDEEIVTKEFCLLALNSNVESSQYVPICYREDEDILAIERKLGICSVEIGWYERGYFYVKERLPRYKRRDWLSVDVNSSIIKKTKEFDEFYALLNGNLHGIDLRGYKFKNVDINNYDLTGCIVDSKILKKYGLYDDEFYTEHIKNYDDKEIEDYSLIELESTEVSVRFDEYEEVDRYDEAIYYISDIHLNHKLRKKFPRNATKLEVIAYIKELVDMLISNADRRGYLLIGGDVSYDFEISEIFYSLLSKRWNPANIFVVLGNHELWDGDPAGKTDVDLIDVINKYRDLSYRFGFSLLHNSLCVFKGEERGYEKVFVPEAELVNLSNEELRRFFYKAPFAVLGGIGFSGYNMDFNASNGIYRNAVRTKEQDILESEKFENVYERLRDAVPDKKIIILTHTPKENWSTKDYNDNWIYVNGHTHRNHFELNDGICVYADNQIGYSTMMMNLKHFYISGLYDTFADYEDGIHEITRQQYIDFNRGKRINITFSEKNGKIYMLKRNGLYCFMYKNANGNYLLDGGRIRSTLYSLNYYYDNMVSYANSINLVFGSYNKALNKLSCQIKQLGGSGNIHGSIVDIDWFNHVYLNANDGSVTPYFATSIVDKVVYPSVPLLLKAYRPDMYANYLLEKDDDEDYLEIDNVEIIKNATFVSETFMYKQSNFIKALQYTSNSNVIRLWNDELLSFGKRIAKQD